MILTTAWLVLGASAGALGYFLTPGLFDEAGGEGPAAADPSHLDSALSDSALSLADDELAESSTGDATIPMPPVGRFALRRHGDRYDLVANQVSRRTILRAIAARGRFVLVDRVYEHPVITVSVEGRPLTTLLEDVLNDIPFSLEYEARGQKQRVALSRVTIGLADAPTVASVDGDESRETKTKASDAAKRAKSEPPPRTRPAWSEEERLLAMERRTKREQQRAEEFREELESPDPEARALAVTTFDAEDPAQLELIAPLLGGDPDPEVRANVADELAWGDPAVAVPMLIQALGDPSPDVVEAAAISLGTLDAVEARGALLQLRNHPSEQIRSAVEIALAMMKGA